MATKRINLDDEQGREGERTIIRPHRTLRPVPPVAPIADIADVPTALLVRETPKLLPVVPAIQPMPQLPKPIVVTPLCIAETRGRRVYKLSFNLRLQHGGYDTMNAELGSTGSGYIFRENTDKTYSPVPVYLTFDEICQLYAAALDALHTAKAFIPDPDMPQEGA